MNRSHANLTSWGLEHVVIGPCDFMLDIGCGGGRTVQRLSALAPSGKIVGIDYAPASVAASRSIYRDAIRSGLVAIQQASFSHLPFREDSCDLVTAVETHYYWPDLPNSMREIYRVLKPNGTVSIIAGVYDAHGANRAHRTAMKLLGGNCLSPDAHRDLLLHACYTDVEVFFEIRQRLDLRPRPEAATLRIVSIVQTEAGKRHSLRTVRSAVGDR